MKKTGLSVLLGAAALGVLYFGFSSDRKLPDPQLGSSQIQTGAKIDDASTQAIQNDSAAHLESNRSEVSVTHLASLSNKTDRSATPPEAATESSELAKSTPSPSADKHQPNHLEESGPSIGTVRVLGHRGCDQNTQGWYLGVGKPEQYDYIVSEDGESLEVKANVPTLGGAFEFVRCADAGAISGKRVRFTAKIKAEGVSQIAQIRLRGENTKRERIVYQDTQVIGTYDWKDFSVEADVAPDVTIFNYGLTFRSSGKLWISHPTFNIIR
jgi:hypothetical protein